jgi:hypothetical protein
MRKSDLLEAIKPFVIGWIGEAGGGEGPYAPSPHALGGAHHSGSLGTAQYPDALLRDGSRSLTGNLGVGDGVTIDGVDVSALESDFEAHELATAAAAHSGIGVHSHEDAAGGGQLDHGAALTGLGDDDHTQYLNAARHLAIGDASPHHAAATAGDGIAVTGQQVAVDLATNSLLEFSSGDLRVAAAAAGDGLTGGGGSALAVDLHGTWSGLEISSAKLRVDLDEAFDWTAPHTFGAGIDVDGTLEFQGAQQVTTTSGNVTVAPAGDIVLDPGGSDVLPGGSIEDDLGDYNRMWRTLYAAEMYVETLVAQDVLATIGGRIIVAPTTKLIADVTTIALAITVEHDNLSVDDYVLLKAAPGGVPQTEVMQITGGPTPSGDGYLYGVSRDEDGSGVNSWYAGDAVCNLGHAAGEGYIELTSTSTVHADLGPNITIYTRTGTANWDDAAPTVALGNLESFLDYSSYEVGLAVGDDLTVDPSVSAGDFSGFSADRTNGLRLWNTGVKLYDGSDLRIEMDPTATGTDSMLWAGPSSSDKRFVVTGDGDVWLSTLAISGDMGGMLYSLADGLLLLGPPLKVVKDGSTNYLLGSRKELATVSGALHVEPGRWNNTVGLVIEPATTNLISNPSGETNTTGWSSAWGDTVSRVNDEVRAVAGNYAFKVVSNGGGGGARYTDISGLTPSDTVSVTVYVYVPSTNTTVSSVRLNVWDGGGFSNAVYAISDRNDQWQRLEVQKTVPAGGSIRVGVYYTASTSGDVVYFDAAQVEEKDRATSYADGSLGDGYSWSSTEHGSTSSRTATQVNLDDLVGLISGEDTLTYRVVAQMPYNYDDSWNGTYNIIMDARGASESDRIRIRYRTDANSLEVYANGSYLIMSGVEFSAGDWLDIALTVDYGNDSYILYLNGESIGSDTTSLSAPTLTEWNVGSSYAGASVSGMTLGEYAVLDEVLSADEIAAIHASKRPLSDGGAIERPGIYILDGEFRLQSSQTGQRVEMVPEGIGIYDDTGYTGVARLLGGRVDTTGAVMDAEGDALGWFGYDDGDTLQVAWYAAGDNAGKIVAGAGDVFVDADGLTIIEGSGAPNKIKWITSGGYSLSDIHEDLAGGVNAIVIGTYAYSTTTGQVSLVAVDGDSSNGFLNVYSGGIETDGWVSLADGVSAPSTRSGFAVLYVDSADGDLKVKFGDGTVKTIVTDS